MILNKKISLTQFFLSIVTIFYVHSSQGGICPDGGAELCEKSIEQAAAKMIECDPTDPDVKECALIFVATLSEVDDNAPFFEGMYETKAPMGNLDDYKRVVGMMKQPDQDPDALLALYDLSKAVILQTVDFNKVSPEDLKELEDMVGQTFERREFRPLSKAEPHHREDWITYCKNRARSIVWPDTPQGVETERDLDKA